MLMVKEFLNLEKGKLTGKELNALAETLSYVGGEESVTLKIENSNSTNALYAWAIANSTITFPYLSLKEASEKVSTNLAEVPEWGYCGATDIRLVANESLEDSAAWLAINALCERHFAGHVQYMSDVPATFPSWDNADTAKNNFLETITHRILELSRNPLSATCRNGESITSRDMARNVVDFVVLEHIYNKAKRWDHLRIGDIPIRHGRRFVSVEVKADSKGKGKTTFREVPMGYKLAGSLQSLCGTHGAKVPENEPFARLILELLWKITDEAIEGRLSTVELPLAFFERPSVQLRKELRKGPQIKTAKGVVKENLYAPFSFVKSSECGPMPIVTKKECTELSSKVIQTLDTINTLAPSAADHTLVHYREFLNLAYLISDTCREKWRKTYSIPIVSELATLLDATYSKDEGNGKVSFNSERLRAAKEDVKNITFYEAATNGTELAAIEEAIKSASQKRKKAGPFRT
jgi:hypothetical protein